MSLSTLLKTIIYVCHVALIDKNMPNAQCHWILYLLIIDTSEIIQIKKNVLSASFKVLEFFRKNESVKSYSRRWRFTVKLNMYKFKKIMKYYDYFLGET